MRFRRYWVAPLALVIGGGLWFVLLNLITPQPPFSVPPLGAPDGGFASTADLIRAGHIMQAAARLEADAARSGWTAADLQQIGDLWRQAGDADRAAAYWSAALAQGGDDSRLRDLARIRVEQRRWPEAVALLDRLIAAPETREQDRLWAHWQRGMIRVAVDPTGALVDLRRGGQISAQGDIIDPLIGLISLEIVDPLRLAGALDETGRPAQARLILETALSRAGDALDPVTRARWTAYAAVLAARDGRAADAYLAHALTLAAADSRVQFLAGLYWRARQDAAASLSAFQAAAALDTGNAAVLAELGRAYVLTGDYEQARTWLERAVAITEPDSPYQADLDQLGQSVESLLESLLDAAGSSGE